MSHDLFLSKKSKKYIHTLVSNHFPQTPNQSLAIYKSVPVYLDLFGQLEYCMMDNEQIDGSCGWMDGKQSYDHKVMGTLMLEFPARFRRQTRHSLVYSIKLTNTVNNNLDAKVQVTYARKESKRFVLSESYN